jgi:hypothetical protein
VSWRSMVRGVVMPAESYREAGDDSASWDNQRLWLRGGEATAKARGREGRREEGTESTAILRAGLRAVAPSRLPSVVIHVAGAYDETG